MLIHFFHTAAYVLACVYVHEQMLVHWMYVYMYASNFSMGLELSSVAAAVHIFPESAFTCVQQVQHVAASFCCGRSLQKPQQAATAACCSSSMQHRNTEAAASAAAACSSYGGLSPREQQSCMEELLRRPEVGDVHFWCTIHYARYLLLSNVNRQTDKPKENV